MTSLVQGQITKRVVRDDGVCVPQFVDGGIEVPQPQIHDCKWMQFQKIEEMERHFENTPFDELASRYCVIRNQKDNLFVIFLDNSAVPDYLEKHNGQNECHQMFGQWMIPSFDIDYKFVEGEDLNLSIGYAVETIAKALQIDASELKVVDRSRENDGGYKYSYHIRAPKFAIQRLELADLVRKLKEKDTQQETISLISQLDSAIYRSKG